jgi:hypothetical protein
VARQNEESKVSTELTVIERAAKALGSADHEPALVELAKQAADITTIKNADGRAQVHGAYMTLKTRRTDIRKAGKDARDDATKFSKAVIAEEDRLVAIIEPEETRLLKLREGWDLAVEAERRVKAQAEANRVATIRAMINDMGAIPVGLVDASAEKIASAIDDLDMFEVTSAAFDEFVDSAHLVRTAILAKLRDMHASAVRRAEEAAQLAAERAELERLRAEQAERERVAAAARAEQERIDRERREAEDAQRRAEQEAEQRKIDDQRAEIARQQAAVDAERQRLADEEAARQRAAAEAAAAAQREREEAARAESARIRAEQDAKNAEVKRREREQFVLNGPSAAEIIEALAERYDVDCWTVSGWMCRHVWAEVEVAA